jgi:hypothetical protein
MGPSSHYSCFKADRPAAVICKKPELCRLCKTENTVKIKKTFPEVYEEGQKASTTVHLPFTQIAPGNQDKQHS